MKILAIETSCDDTGVAILEVKKGKFSVLSNIVSSQQIHANYGGVFPMMAKREHQRNLVPVLQQALKDSNLLVVGSQEVSQEQKEVLKGIFEKEDDLYGAAVRFFQNYQKPAVDVLAVTVGPGLEPCLYVGVNFAKALSYMWNLKVIPVNHIEAHILVNFLENPKIKFPAMALVVSGGHTQLVLTKEIGAYEILGETRDDAAGECFDKAARILNLGYPGGPIISKIANEQKVSNIELPRPMISSKDYDFSFSGLKTAVLYKVRDSKVDDEFVKNMAVEIQQAIIDVLVKKTLQAAKDFNVKTIILGGGVSANSELRSQFEFKIQNSKFKILFPQKNLSTDNGLMIAVAAYFHRNKKTSWKNLEVNANLRVD